MTPTASRPAPAAHAPQAFRDALAELVQIGLSVARMVGQVAQTETALAVAAAQAADELAPLAGSLGEAIEADRVAVAAAAAQETVAARTEMVSRAFARVSRSVRMTVLLAERLDRGWARQGGADDRDAPAQRQAARAAGDVIDLETDGTRPERLGDLLAERRERLDVEAALGNRPTEQVVREICRGLGLDPPPLPPRSPSRDPAAPAQADATGLTGFGNDWGARPWRPLDG